MKTNKSAHEFIAEARDCAPTAPSLTASMLGRRSGENRRKNGHVYKIISEFMRMDLVGIKQHHRAKRIAAMLDCTVEYVRRILRKYVSYRP